MIEIVALGVAVAVFLAYVEWRLRRLLRKIEDELMPEPAPPVRARSGMTKDDIRRSQGLEPPTKDDIIATVEDAQRRGRLRLTKA